MKKIFLLVLRGALILIGASVSAVAEKEPGLAVTAEVWRFDVPEGISSKAVFEQWRAQRPPGEPQTLALDGLTIPAREAGSMVRVSGLLIAPITGHYAFTIRAPDMHRFHRPDETELWIHDGPTGEWRLAQCTGNPVKLDGRTRIEAGVPRRFELWTMGINRTVIDWELLEFAATGKSTLRIPRQTVPASALGPRIPAPDDKHGDGLPDSWKKRHGLEGNDGTGPNGPWGDPDGDGLPNWREQLAGTSPVQADTEGRAGLVRWEIWRDIPGRYVFDLRRAGHFPTGPREVRFLDRLEIPTGNGERYGSRVRGWLVAPADGEYRFGISADDGAELWLGENESWQSKRLIAQADLHGSGRLRWFRRNEKGENVPLDSAQTGRVTLKAGSRYYVEILHKQDHGSDHCAVSWIKPGAEKPERITKEYLVSWQPCPTDADDDGLPDEWQKSAGLMAASVDASMRHAEADPDGDGASNREEWLAATDPLDRGDAPESGRMLTSEAWTGIPGHRITDLVNHPRYPAAPDFTTRVDNLDFGREGQNYGARLRGYLTAPADGIYHFAIAGNNSAILYLGESEDKTTKRVIARAEHGTDWRFFSSDPRQRGGPFELKEGRRYYIEMLYKRGTAEPSRRGDENDHSSVAWTRPGHKESVIPPEYFSPYLPQPGDLDDDDLPDEWEKSHGLDPAVPGGNHGAWGDPDGDGLENFREFQLGLDPNVPDVHGTPGLALWEYWDNREDLMPALRDKGGTLSERLSEDLRYPLDPVRRGWRDSLESPRGVGVNYASRMRAVIIAPETGDYVFAISSHHAGELFLSPDESKFKRRTIASITWASRYREWGNQKSQVSAPVRLEAGARYYIEALHAQGRNPLRRDHLCVAWQAPGSDKFEVIGAQHLVAFFRDPNDQDDDDLPDDWEKRYGLDSTDPRGDHGPHGDPDRDGLTNMEEFHLGTDPRNRDTDGDGIFDYDEVHLYGTNPLIDDVTPPVHVGLLPVQLVRSDRNWGHTADGGLLAVEARGDYHFDFDIDAPGVYQIELVATARATGFTPPLPVAALVNGIEVGRAGVRPGGSDHRWLTPWLQAGRHVVTIRDRNPRRDALLVIHGVNLYRHEGTGTGKSGIPAWLEALLRRDSRVETTIEESIISPVAFEGAWRWAGTVRVAAAGEDAQVRPALTGRWYCDVPLMEDGAETPLEFHFENGAFAERRTVVWSEFDPFLHDGSVMHLRAGASLRLASSTSEDHGEATIRYHLDDEPLDEAGIARFDRAGIHQLRAACSAGDSVTITLHVHQARFAAPVSMETGKAAEWHLPAVGPEALIESDPLLDVLASRRSSTGPGRVLELRPRLDGAGQPRLVARTPDGGEILDAGMIDVFKLIASSQSRDARHIATLEDGTRVVEVIHAIVGGVPPGLEMWLVLLVPDAVFANGDTRLRLTAADFDEHGNVRILIYKAPGEGIAYVCHRITTNTTAGTSEDIPAGDGADDPDGGDAPGSPEE